MLMKSALVNKKSNFFSNVGSSQYFSPNLIFVSETEIFQQLIALNKFQNLNVVPTNRPKNGFENSFFYFEDLDDFSKFHSPFGCRIFIVYFKI